MTTTPSPPITPAIPDIRRHTWNHHHGEPNHGVLISMTRARVFVPRDSLRTFADFIHDTADHYEQQ